MAKAPRAVIPPGKEDEYVRDDNGNAVHVKYGNDSSMDGTVIPTGKHFRVGGGSHGFSIDDMDILQNIVAYDENGQRTVTTVTRRELAAGLRRAKNAAVAPEEATPEAIAQLGAAAEDIFARVGAAAQSGMLQVIDPSTFRPDVSQLMAKVAQHNPFEEVSMPAKKAAKKKTKKKKARRNSRRVAETAPAAQESIEEQQQEQKTVAPPPLVRFRGPFGTVTANFSGVFRDGMCLVMYTDTRQLPSAYSLPESDDPMQLTVEHDGHVVECIWAGIQFTMPNVPVTFIVLLVVEEEQADGEGRPGQAGFDDM